MAKRIDITGQTFGSLTAIKYSGYGRKWIWECSACGNTNHIADASSIKHMATKKYKDNPLLPACGCLHLKAITKHNNHKHPLYAVYRNIKDRCYNDKSPNFQWYGGKGVTMCDEWKNDYSKFHDWCLANNWQAGMHIDKDILCLEKGVYPRIYSPETCLIVSPSVNSDVSSNRNSGATSIKISEQNLDRLKELFLLGVTQAELAKIYDCAPSTIDSALKQLGVK